MAEIENTVNVSGSRQSIDGGIGTGWPMKIWDPSKSDFHHIINNPDGDVSVADLSEYFDTHIELNSDRFGAVKNVLYQSLTQKASQNTQSWYELYYESPSNITDGDMYIKYWMKFPANLKESVGHNSWRSVFFWKTLDTDYRIEAYVSTNTNIHPNGDLHFYIHGDRPNTISGEYKEDWQVRNKEVVVPLAEWFLMEFFWHRSHEPDGRVYWAVNGEVIADHYEQNYGDYNNHINRICPFGVYGIPDIYPSEQWIDDVEILDGFP